MGNTSGRKETFQSHIDDISQQPMSQNDLLNMLDEGVLVVQRTITTFRDKEERRATITKFMLEIEETIRSYNQKLGFSSNTSRDEEGTSKPEVAESTTDNKNNVSKASTVRTLVQSFQGTEVSRGQMYIPKGQSRPAENTQLAAVEDLQKQLQQLQEENSKLQERNHELLTRLSKIAAEKLTSDNPAIADLSDLNRPTKLGELYSEIYDNEWTDAMEGLQRAGWEESECIDTLRDTLENIIHFCARKCSDLLKNTAEAVLQFENVRKSVHGQYNLGADEDLQSRWRVKHCRSATRNNRSSIQIGSMEKVDNQLKRFRKEVAETIVPIVQKAYMSASWNNDECVPEMKPYIKKCLFLGWMMAVQAPPLTILTCPSGETFNKDMYKEYTQSGSKVDFVVWPALLLHEEGPLISKGVAQGLKT